MRSRLPNVTFSVTNLGVLPHGVASEATDINNDGIVAGDSHVQISVDGKPVVRDHVFLYKHGRMIDLGAEPGYADGYAGYIGVDNRVTAGGVNGNGPLQSGSFVVRLHDGKPVWSAVRDTSGKAGGVVLAGINDHGAATGWINSTPSEGAVWHTDKHNYRVADPLARSANDDTSGFAIDDWGDVAGMDDHAGVKSGLFRATLWVKGESPVLLPTLGGPSGRGTAVRRLGLLPGQSSSRSVVTVAGSADLPNDNAHASLWRVQLDGNRVVSVSRPEDLGTVPGYSSSIAAAISTTGLVVGSVMGFNPNPDNVTDSNVMGLNIQLRSAHADSAPPPNHAVIWQAGKIADLNSLIPATSGWVLNDAFGINAAGDIVGDGTFHGQPRAFLLRPRFNVSYHLTKLAAGRTSCGSIASAVTDSGAVAGLASGGPSRSEHLYLYQSGSRTNLGAIPGVSATIAGIDKSLNVAVSVRSARGSEEAYVVHRIGSRRVWTALPSIAKAPVVATSMSADGTIVGYTQGSRPEAVTWRLSGSAYMIRPLATPSGWTAAWAMNATNANTAVGVVEGHGGIPAAVVWKLGKQPTVVGASGIPSIGTGSFTATASSSYVIGASFTGKRTHAVLWGPSGASIDLGALTGFPASIARSSNKSGWVVGTAGNRSVATKPSSFRKSVLPRVVGSNLSCSRHSSPSTRAFIAHDGFMVNLERQVTNGSGWILSSATAINQTGEIVGYGEFHGKMTGFALTPSVQAQRGF